MQLLDYRTSALSIVPSQEETNRMSKVYQITTLLKEEEQMTLLMIQHLVNNSFRYKKGGRLMRMGKPTLKLMRLIVGLLKKIKT